MFACQDNDHEPGGADLSNAPDLGVMQDQGMDMSAPPGDMMARTDLDTTPTDAEQDLPASPGCSPDDIEACRYIPTMRYDPGSGLQNAMTFSYEDVTGAQREVPFDIRLPVDYDGAAPLIIWSHGGSGGKSNPLIIAKEWGSVFTRAGFAFITIAHDRQVDTQPLQCESIGVQTCQRACTGEMDCQNTPIGDGRCLPQLGLCQFYKPLNWDRPHDVKALLDYLESDEGMAPMIRERIDVAKVIYAGHSAGAGATMMVAGVGRSYAEVFEQIGDNRPLGFMSFSPQPPGDDGFTTENYAGEDCPDGQAFCLTRPHLVVTGVGDGNVADDEPPKGEGRREAFRALKPSGNKTLYYITEEAARHTTFEHTLDACERFSRNNNLNPDLYPERCSDYHMWMDSIALAFADAVLREDERAAAYLASDDAVTLSGGVAEMERR